MIIFPGFRKRGLNGWLSGFLGSDTGNSPQSKRDARKKQIEGMVYAEYPAIKIGRLAVCSKRLWDNIIRPTVSSLRDPPLQVRATQD